MNTLSAAFQSSLCVKGLAGALGLIVILSGCIAVPGSTPEEENLPPWKQTLAAIELGGHRFHTVHGGGPCPEPTGLTLDMVHLGEIRSEVTGPDSGSHYSRAAGACFGETRTSAFVFWWFERTNEGGMSVSTEQHSECWGSSAAYCVQVNHLGEDGPRFRDRSPLSGPVTFQDCGRDKVSCSASVSREAADGHEARWAVYKLHTDDDPALFGFQFSVTQEIQSSSAGFATGTNVTAATRFQNPDGGLLEGKDRWGLDVALLREQDAWPEGSELRLGGEFYDFEDAIQLLEKWDENVATQLAAVLLGAKLLAKAGVDTSVVPSLIDRADERLANHAGKPPHGQDISPQDAEQITQLREMFLQNLVAHVAPSTE